MDQISRAILWCMGVDASPERQKLAVAVPRPQVVAYLKERVKRLLGTYRGRIKDDRFTVAVQHIWLNNPWFPLLHGQMLDTADGCTIETYFDVPGYIKLFFAAWLVFAVAFSFFGVYMAIFHARAVGFFFAGLPAYGVLIARLGCRVGKPDEAKLQSLLEELRSLKPD